MNEWGSSENVVTIEPRLPGAKSMMMVERAPQCPMHAFLLDEKERTIKCRLCEAVFEPFDAMAYLAHRWPDYGHHRETLRNEIATLIAERDRLQREVADLRSRASGVTSIFEARDSLSISRPTPRPWGNK